MTPFLESAELLAGAGPTLILAAAYVFALVRLAGACRYLGSVLLLRYRRWVGHRWSFAVERERRRAGLPPLTPRKEP